MRAKGEETLSRSARGEGPLPPFLFYNDRLSFPAEKLDAQDGVRKRNLPAICKRDFHNRDYRHLPCVSSPGSSPGQFNPPP